MLCEDLGLFVGVLQKVAKIKALLWSEVYEEARVRTPLLQICLILKYFGVRLRKCKKATPKK